MPPPIDDRSPFGPSSDMEDATEVGPCTARHYRDRHRNLPSAELARRPSEHCNTGPEAANSKYQRSRLGSGWIRKSTHAGSSVRFDRGSTPRTGARASSRNCGLSSGHPRCLTKPPCRLAAEGWVTRCDTAAIGHVDREQYDLDDAHDRTSNLRLRRWRPRACCPCGQRTGDSQCNDGLASPTHHIPLV